MLPHPSTTHKGQNGKVAILSGSKDYYGATVLTSLACLKSGIDLVFPIIPECNRIIQASYSPEFIIKTYPEDYFTSESIALVLDNVKNVDVLIIGPGLGKNKRTLKALNILIPQLNFPLVIDADALYALNTSFKLPNNSVLTPHKTELKELLKKNLPTNQKDLEIEIKHLSENTNATVVLKGPIDIIVNQNEIHLNRTGNESLTKGGTGDILAGLIGGYIAQGLTAYEASKLATKNLGEAGDKLFKQKGYKYLTGELIDIL